MTTCRRILRPKHAGALSHASPPAPTRRCGSRGRYAQPRVERAVTAALAGDNTLLEQLPAAERAEAERRLNRA